MVVYNPRTRTGNRFPLTNFRRNQFCSYLDLGSRLHNSEKLHFCCLRHTVYVVLIKYPETNADYKVKNGSSFAFVWKREDSP